MDRLLYKIVSEQFRSIPSRGEQGPTPEYLYVSLASTGKSRFMGAVGIDKISRYAWYFGFNGFGGSGASAGNGNQLSSPGSFTRESCTMVMVLKNGNGRQLWAGRYNYKGGRTMSGRVVTTAAQVVRLLVTHLEQKYKAEFGNS